MCVCVCVQYSDEVRGVQGSLGMMSEWSTGFLSREYVCHGSLFTPPFPRVGGGGGAEAGEA